MCIYVNHINWFSDPTPTKKMLPVVSIVCVMGAIVGAANKTFSSTLESDSAGITITLDPDDLQQSVWIK